MFWNRSKQLRYTCACCGEEFDGAPSFAYDIPVFVSDVPEEEREDRVLIGSDLCHVRSKGDENPDDDIFAIRINLEIPIHGSSEPFLWGLWVSQSEESFMRYMETYDQDQSAETSFGWLPVTMAYYRDRNPVGFHGGLACDVQWGPKGQRPTITLHESDHPLYIDQSRGISWTKAVEIARKCMRTLHKKL